MESLMLQASQGDAEAQVKLGHCYETGNGVSIDEEQAMLLWRQAAEQGHPEGMFLMACCFENAVGVEIDDEEAISWHLRAAEAGHVGSQEMLACMYETGFGVPRNYKTAVAWFIRAAEQGSLSARKDLEGLYDHLEESSLEEAGALFHLAAEQGCPAAQARLGEYYMLGSLGVKCNIRAADLLHQAALQGEPKAFFLLHRMFLHWRMDNFHTVEKEWDAVFQREEDMLLQAIAYGSTEAMVVLADRLMPSVCYDQPDDFEKSINLYRKAAGAGNTDAFWKLSRCVAQGRCVKKDPVVAAALAWKSECTEDDLEVSGFFQYVSCEEMEAGRALASSWENGLPEDALVLMWPFPR